MRLDRETGTRRSAYGTTEQNVVAEHEIGWQLFEHTCSVGVDVASPLSGGEFLEQARLEPLVGVEHEHR